MRCTKGDNEAVFKSKGDIEADEGARTFAKVSDEVLSVRHVVFYD